MSDTLPALIDRARRRLADARNSAELRAAGDAETMTVEASAIFHEGERYPPQGYEPADLESIKRDLAAWSQWAARHPGIILPRKTRP